MTSVVRHSRMRFACRCAHGSKASSGSSSPDHRSSAAASAVPSRDALAWSTAAWNSSTSVTTLTIGPEHNKIVTHRKRGRPIHADCRQGPACRVQGLMQVVSCGVSVEVWPELVSELVPVKPMRRFQRQQLDQRLSLAQAPGAVGDRSVTLGDLETA